MTKHSTTIGMDLGDTYSQLYVLDNASGDELEQARVPTREDALQRWFEQRGPAQVVLEVGGHAGWISRMLSGMGHEVLVADPRKARKLMGNEEKDDDIDAEMLARIGRFDAKLLKPVKLRSEQTQSRLSIVRSRDTLVGARTKLINHVRGSVKAMGKRLPRCATESFHKLRGWVPAELEEALGPTLTAIEALTEQIRKLERTIETTCAEEHPETARIRQIKGVGPITALAYVLIVEDPTRFAKSRQVGPYLGLCRKRWKSGDEDPELRITKAGDALLRRLLINSAHYIMGPFGPDCDLRRWGLAYVGRGGKNAKKRAIVAVARRLAVLMHRLWVTGADYDPLYNAKKDALKGNTKVAA